jgi:hypothetical protein
VAAPNCQLVLYGDVFWVVSACSDLGGSVAGMGDLAAAAVASVAVLDWCHTHKAVVAVCVSHGRCPYQSLLTVACSIQQPNLEMLGGWGDG